MPHVAGASGTWWGQGQLAGALSPCPGLLQRNRPLPLQRFPEGRRGSQPALQAGFSCAELRPP